MSRNMDNSKISAEVLAAFLDGNATAQESLEILETIPEDASMRELLNISRLVDDELCPKRMALDIIPMTAMAATCAEDNYCCLECEKYVLRQMGVEFEEKQLLVDASNNGWLKFEGTALHNVGRHLEGKGLVVNRRYDCSIEDIVAALDVGCSVIAAVDGGELLGNRIEEVLEDVEVGLLPDHIVVVVGCDTEGSTVTVYDPNSPNIQDVYSLEQFEDAWADSKNYLVVVNPKDMVDYHPCPIDLSNVELSDELNELREAIAENAHDVWALERIAQGWSYGPCRDDAKKHNPCLVPYSQLPDNEKKFDRDMAMDTLKLVCKLGYDIVKREK